MTEPLIAIDIGNTTIKIGLWQKDHWQDTWRIETPHDQTSIGNAVYILDSLQQVGLLEQINAQSQIVLSSVVPPLITPFKNLFLAMNIEPLIISTKLNLGIAIDVDFPEQVGTDRLVNASAVYHLYGGPAIALDFGTATKFDVVSAEGAFIGGSIAPGIGLSMEALAGRAAQLYKIALEPPPSPIGRNTIHALQSGVFLGYVSLVEGMIARLRSAIPDGDHCKVVATGGYAPLFQNQTKVIDAFAPRLTLDGLCLIYELNRR